MRLSADRVTEFYWGVGTSSYQIEGAANQGGRGKSIWDTFCERRGNVKNGESGAVSCDFYHRFADDMKLLKDLGVNAFRFSLSWPRILPDGTGRPNPEGIDFYNRVIDTAVRYGIEPFLTLYHWDMPESVQLKGGLLNRDTAGWFGEYAEVAAKAFGDRVRHFITVNEPQCIIGDGLVNGVHAPGARIYGERLTAAIHNLLLCHGRAVSAVRAVRSDATAGLVNCAVGFYPASDDDATVEAARQATFALYDALPYSLSLYCDPVYLGAYPQAYTDSCPELADIVRPGDMAEIGQDCELFYQNVYSGSPLSLRDGQTFEPPAESGPPANSLGWRVDENGLYWIARFVYERYRKPVIIAENGYCGLDNVCLDGKVHDADRIDYLRRHIGKTLEAKRDGADIRGYLLWTLLDNFEWSYGYTKRFGLVHVNFATQKRTPKDSYYWYRDFLKSTAATADRTYTQKGV